MAMVYSPMPYDFGLGDYFDDLYSPPDELITICGLRGTHRTIALSTLQYLSSLLAKIACEDGGILDLTDVAETIIDETRLSPRTIHTRLNEFLGLLKPRGQVEHSNLDIAVSRNLTRHLNRDLQRDPYYPIARRTTSGLHQTRQTFAILAHFAHLSQSPTLALALTDFFARHWQHILHDSSRYLLSDWGTSISALAGLVSDSIIHQCMSYLLGKRPGIMTAYRNSTYHDPRLDAVIDLLTLIAEGDVGYDRGRRWNRGLVPYGAAQRALTAPPVYHHRHPRSPARLLLPPVGMHTPKVEQLEMKQKLLEHEIVDLRDQVQSGLF